MQQNGRTRLLARLALLLVAIIWGSTLVVSKSTTGTIHPNLLIALRFLISVVVLGLVFLPRLKRIDWGYVGSGAIIGLFLFLAHSAQTIGVTDAEGMPGRSGFLSAAYCVIVPFLVWAVNRVRPDRYNIIAAVLCITGIGFVSFGEVPSEQLAASSVVGFTLPDALALLSGIFFAAHIVTIERFSRGKDPILITIMQFVFAGIFAAITVMVQDPHCLATAQWSVATPAIFYLAVVATAIALLLQNLGQKYTDPSSAAIILGTESISCVVFGVFVSDEKVTSMLAIGLVLIFLAIIVSETKLSFLHGAKGAALKVKG